jgi:NAD(P)-dependent dehydrogenase (short-subunit alcohol dehydrogenase family)
MGNASLMAMTVALGGESVGKGVRVVGVNPGLIETERMMTMNKARAVEKFGDEARWREFLADMPLARAGAPEEVADLVAFLASDRASWISGTIVTIDGGVTKRATL